MQYIKPEMEVEEVNMCEIIGTSSLEGDYSGNPGVIEPIWPE